VADDELSTPLGQNAKKKRRRFKLPITLATLEVTPDGMRPEIHELGGD